MATTYPPNSYDFSNTFTHHISGDTFSNAHNLEQGGHTSMARTPSPTPSEAREMKNSGVFDWKTMGRWQFWIRKEWWLYYIILIVIVTLTALMSVYHKQIVQWLEPAATWMHDLNFGWLIPIGVLFVISFPPLFGHEIVAILCGLVWGLWVGFGIVAAGTFLGEVGNFYAFKYCCRARGEKLERTKITYACLAKVVRDGGFKIALIARLSAIPGHFTTAIFSTCGMGIFVFSLAAILSMPKQFITVYLGVILEQKGSGEKEDPKSKLISNIVLAITILITVLAMWYILKEMKAVKPEVIYARRKARQAKLAKGMTPMVSNVSLGTQYQPETFNPGSSDSHLPLTAKFDHQQWDNHGRAVGYVGDPQLNNADTTTMIYAPRPQRSASQSIADTITNTASAGYPATMSSSYSPAPHPSNTTYSAHVYPDRPMYDEPTYNSPLR